MKLYIGDYLGDTHHLSALEHGAYLLLLMAMWRAGGKLPRDDEKLRKLARCTADEWAAIRATVLAFFTRSGGLIRHARVSKEIAKYDSVFESAKRAGKASGLKRANKNNELDTNGRCSHVERETNQPEPESDTISGTSVPSIVSESETSVSVSSPRANKPRPTKRCPADWQPDASVYRVAAEYGFSDDDMRRELETMRDYQFRTAHTDWQAVGRNWLRKAQPRRHSGQPNLSFRMQDRLLDEVENREVDQEFWRLMEANDAVGHGKGGSDQIGDYGALVALPAPKTHRN